MKFIETRETACKGNYPINVLLAVDNISTVLECEDDYKCCVVTMKDGKRHVVSESYSSIIKKIKEFEGE